MSEETCPKKHVRRKNSAERLLKRRRERRRQKLRRTVRRNHHIVFTTQAEFTHKVNPRLIRKGHAWLQDSFAAAHKVRMLVSVQADAMSQAVREGLVVRPEPGIGDDFARRVIHGAGTAACARRIQSRILRSAHNFKNALY